MSFGQRGGAWAAAGWTLEGWVDLMRPRGGSREEGDWCAGRLVCRETGVQGEWCTKVVETYLKARGGEIVDGAVAAIHHRAREVWALEARGAGGDALDEEGKDVADAQVGRRGVLVVIGDPQHGARVHLVDVDVARGGALASGEEEGRGAAEDLPLEALRLRVVVQLDQLVHGVAEPHRLELRPLDEAERELCRGRAEGAGERGCMGVRECVSARAEMGGGRGQL